MNSVQVPPALTILLTLLLSSFAPACAMVQRNPPVRAVINLTGPGLVAGDWNVGLNLVTGTDDSYDTVNKKDRARVLEYSEQEARRQGQLPADPVADVKRRLRPEAVLGHGFVVAQRTRVQLVMARQQGARRTVATACLRLPLTLTERMRGSACVIRRLPFTGSTAKRKR